MSNLDPLNDISALEPKRFPALTDEQATFLARVRNTRKQSFMLSMEDCDLLIQIIEELTKCQRSKNRQ